jgi:cytochrome c biogenesis protein CcmG/thiol:disulfide interchange protein DsbE
MSARPVPGDAAARPPSAAAPPPPAAAGAEAAAAPAAGRRLRRTALLLAPLGLAAAAGAGFWGMLRGLESGGYDPRGVPSALLGRTPPPFDLPPLEGAERPALTAADLRDPPRPLLVNFFASWCVPCIAEHPMLVRLERQGVPLMGIAYKDRPADALAFLRRHGNPFARIGVDQPGRVAIDWGLYGVPETYLIDRAGLIRWRWAGPLTPEILARDLDALLRRHA